MPEESARDLPGGWVADFGKPIFLGADGAGSCAASDGSGIVEYGWESDRTKMTVRETRTQDTGRARNASVIEHQFRN